LRMSAQSSFVACMHFLIANEDFVSYRILMRRQGEFEFRTWGGKRRGAGRKRVAARPQVPHRTRERVNVRYPILVTTRVLPDVLRLRTKVVYDEIRSAMALASKWMYEPEPVRFVHASVQGNHLRKHGESRAHLRLDPYSSAFALPDWMPGPSIRLADVQAPMPVALPSTWLLAEGWRRAGPISPWARPGSA
jgi:hypothetical protein